MTPFSSNRFLKTFMKAALILDPPTSTTSAPLRMTQVTNAAPQPGQTGCCGGGRGSLSTGQVCERCALNNRCHGRKVTSLQLSALCYKSDILDNATLCNSHPRCQPLNSGSCALGELPSVSLLHGCPHPAALSAFCSGQRTGTEALPHACALSIPFCSPNS